jgi:hypothetical protein
MANCDKIFNKFAPIKILKGNRYETSIIVLNTQQMFISGRSKS